VSARVLPLIADPDVPGALGHDDAFTAALHVIAARHALDVTGAIRVAYGSSPVYLTDALAVKLVPPQWVPELEREIVAMTRAHGRLPVRTPGVVATGELDGWRYLVSERLPGRSARELLPTLTTRERIDLAAALGESLAALHRVPCDDLPTLTVDWDAFARERAAACAGFQKKYGFVDAALASLPQLLADATPLVPDTTRVLLHADLHHEHALLEHRHGAWALTGLIDFGDAAVGHPDYELVTPVFLVVGDHWEALRVFFDAMGFRCDERASRRLMAWSVMHRFNALSRYLPAPYGADALEHLRARYWPVFA
jgi:hygromycin-B 7''-O-kinase